MFTTGDENTHWLRTRFAARLIAERPKDVLDVGAGAGGLLGILCAAGIACRATEADAERVRELVRDGFDAVFADAAALPFQDEPWYDVSIASQRAALAAERWTKAQERLAGRVHDDNHTADDLLRFAGARVHAAARHAVDVTHHVCLRLRAVEDFEADAAPWLAGLAASDARRRAYDAVLEDARRDGLSWNGSVVVAIEKVGAP